MMSRSCWVRATARSPRARRSPPSPAPWSVVAADFNGDGRTDLAVVSIGTSALTIFEGNGDGTFTQVQQLPTGPLCLSVIAADFNGDGLPDLAVACANNDTVRDLPERRWALRPLDRDPDPVGPLRPGRGRLQRRRPDRPGRDQLRGRGRLGLAGQWRRDLPGRGRRSRWGLRRRASPRPTSPATAASISSPPTSSTRRSTCSSATATGRSRHRLSRRPRRRPPTWSPPTSPATASRT